MAPPRTVSGTRPVNVPDQVDLLGDPHQRSDIADGAYADGTGLAQVRRGHRVSRAKHSLPRHRPTPRRIPHRLRGNAIPPATHLSLEDVHIHHVAQIACYIIGP